MRGPRRGAACTDDLRGLAQRVASGEPFDLLVTDHLMPGINGTDLARLVRASRPGIGILLVSGYAEREGLDPELPRLTKPFRKSELAASLAGLRGESWAEAPEAQAVAP